MLDPTMRIIRSDFVRAPDYLTSSSSPAVDDTTPTPDTGECLSPVDCYMCELSNCWS